jgi:ATP-dependent exoDNAse (exonuclease V) beta subunit
MTATVAGRPPFTPEQSAAVADRTGSALLAANAGSGKTAVMVERFVEAVLDDGVPVGGILALTFTEKAAGELRERVRRRLQQLGEDEHARAVDGAWIGTIHGFCARLLRSRPLAAGLDPRFEVLDEAAAGRLAAAAYDRALDDWAAARGAPAVELAAAYAQTLKEIVLGAHETLRSRGFTEPRLPIPEERPAPSSAALAAARADAAAELAIAGAGVRVTEGRTALQACERLLAAGEDPAGGGPPPPHPADLDAAKLGAGAKALTTPACEAYRAAWEAYRSACADHHARAALILLDDLLRRFGAGYERLKASRAGVDFEDLELGVRDLLASESERRRWAERFSLIMVDEFQDTNRLQLDLLEALERDNLFAVGDEFQSIYRFRHADVRIFRERRSGLGEDRVRGLAANFRSEAELLDVLNAAFAPELGEAFRPLVAGRGRSAPVEDLELRLFDPDGPTGEPPVELLITDTRGWDERAPALGLAALADQPWRRAEARLVAHRLREEISAGRRAGDVVVLVRATASLRLFEQALEDQGLPTYVVGGRGYWSQEQVRDGLAYLAALANPRDEAAFYAVLASPFCGASSDALALLGEAGRGNRRGPWAALRDAAAAAAPGSASAGSRDPAAWLGALAPEERDRLLAFARFFGAERARAERLPVETLLERAIVETGYDLAILVRAGGERRLANLRKLMRLARDYEHAEGRDLRGFLSFAVTQDLAEAREGEAALESEGLDAVRLMTIHRAKGLEFPVVCVADLGRQGAGGRPRLLLGHERSGDEASSRDRWAVGLRLAALGGGDAVPALAYERLAAEEDRADAEEERRLLYVAMTRAREKLILSGGVDCERWPEPRPGGAPLDWIVRAMAGDPRGLFAGGEPVEGASWPGLVDDAAARPVGVDGVLERTWDGRAARLRCRLNSPATVGVVLPEAALAPDVRPRSGAPATALPKAPKVMPEPPVRARPAQQRLSYSALQAYARCGYRFYLQRVLGLAPEPLPPPLEPTPGEERLDPRVRGSLVHAMLERLDFKRPETPPADDVRALADRFRVELGSDDVEDIRALVGAFAASPLCERLAAAGRVRREAGFAFTLEPGGGGSLVNGFVDVMASEGEARLIVDYKSDRLDGADPADVIARDYETQRTVYALAALRDGASHVDIAYCFLERPAEPVVRRFTAADAPALAERVTTLARGVLDERYPVTDTPHRELCADCPGRRALCSHPESRTLAPAG